MSAAEREPFFDPVTRLVIALTAMAKPRDPAAWLELLSRFTEAVVREALEHQDEVRERLGLLREVVSCPFCEAQFESRYELGLHAAQCPRMRELGLIDSSTGAAEAETKAEHTHNVAPAAETPAAPSIPVLPAAEQFAAAPSQEDAGSATGGADSKPLAELEATRDAQPKRRGRPPGARTKPKPPDPTVRQLTDAECARLNREYLEARSANGGKRVEGWAKRKARELAVSEAAIYNAVGPAMTALATDKMIGKEQRRIDHALKTPPPRVTRIQGTRY